MHLRTLPLFVAAGALCLGACGRKVPAAASTPTEVQDKAEHDGKPRTMETRRLATAVDAYAQAQNPENDAAVRKAMADVDAELAELEDLLAKRYGREREKIGHKLRRLEAYRSEQTTRFAEAQAGSGLTTPEPRPPASEPKPPSGTARNAEAP